MTTSAPGASARADRRILPLATVPLFGMMMTSTGGSTLLSVSAVIGMCSVMFTWFFLMSSSAEALLQLSPTFLMCLRGALSAQAAEQLLPGTVFIITSFMSMRAATIVP